MKKAKNLIIRPATIKFIRRLPRISGRERGMAKKDRCPFKGIGLFWLLWFSREKKVAATEIKTSAFRLALFLVWRLPMTRCGS